MNAQTEIGTKEREKIYERIYGKDAIDRLFKAGYRQTAEMYDERTGQYYAGWQKDNTNLIVTAGKNGETTVTVTENMKETVHRIAPDGSLISTDVITEHCRVTVEYSGNRIRQITAIDPNADGTQLVQIKADRTGRIKDVLMPRHPKTAAGWNRIGEINIDLPRTVQLEQFETSSLKLGYDGGSHTLKIRPLSTAELTVSEDEVRVAERDRRNYTREVSYLLRPGERIVRSIVLRAPSNEVLYNRYVTFEEDRTSVLPRLKIKKMYEAFKDGMMTEIEYRPEGEKDKPLFIQRKTRIDPRSPETVQTVEEIRVYECDIGSWEYKIRKHTCSNTVVEERFIAPQMDPTVEPLDSGEISKHYRAGMAMYEAENGAVTKLIPLTSDDNVASYVIKDGYKVKTFVVGENEIEERVYTQNDRIVLSALGRYDNEKKDYTVEKIMTYRQVENAEEVLNVLKPDRNNNVDYSFTFKDSIRNWMERNRFLGKLLAMYRKMSEKKALEEAEKFLNRPCRL